MSSFWSAYIAVITLGSLAAVTWLLFANRTRPSDKVQTTGHSADGIEEYDNPLPFWWLLMFVITIAFAILYLLLYPGLGNFKGLLGWTSTEQWEQEVATAEAKYGPVFAAHAATPVEELRNNRDAMRMAQRIYANNCAQCHGSNARGAFGFPNLTDDVWNWGGSAEQIRYSLVNGRNGVMPPWGQALGEDGVHNVALYVQAMSGIIEPIEQSEAGAQQYQMFCASCHGADGKGNQALGAPNLADSVWLYSPDLEQIKHTIRNGRNNRMPAQKDMLSEDKIHLLTAYVLSLGDKQ